MYLGSSQFRVITEVQATDKKIKKKDPSEIFSQDDGSNWIFGFWAGTRMNAYWIFAHASYSVIAEHIWVFGEPKEEWQKW